MKQLPPSWCNPTLLECSQFVRGVTYTKSDAVDQTAGGLLPIIRANNIQARRFEFNDLVYVPANLVSAEQVLKVGDVVIATSSGSISVVGKAAQVRKEQPMSFGAFCGVLRPSPVIHARYFGHFFSSKAYRDAVSDLARGVNINNLKRDHFQAIRIPLAPLGEQERIADKLDTVRTRVDAVNTRLARVVPLIKRFRQSVLAAATSGRLTEDWRAGRTPDWDKPLFADVVVESSTGLVRSASDQFPMQEGLVPYLKMNSVGEMWGYECVDLPGVHCSAAEFKRYELRQGDWLFNTRNSEELVGKSCVWSGPAGVVFNNNLLRVRFRADINPKWVEIFFRSPMGRDLLAALKSATTSVAAIYQRSLMGIPMLRPPEVEQAEIVCRVETLFAFADRLESRLQTAQTAADRLTPSLLAKAFRGELVPQDPNDEPASELLKRLAASTPVSPTKRGRAKSTKAV